MKYIKATAKGGDSIKRLMSFITKTPHCWGWKGTISPDGYGKFHYANGCPTAHRVAYRLLVGPIPPGKQVLHRCDNRSCTNPKHLYLGTNDDNMRDRQLRQRQARGTGHARAVLTEAAVMDIRKRYIKWPRSKKGNPCGLQKLASKYGVSNVTIYNALHGYTWRHI